jgi:hypothetical protein
MCTPIQLILSTYFAIYRTKLIVSQSPLIFTRVRYVNADPINWHTMHFIVSLCYYMYVLQFIFIHTYNFLLITYNAF